MKVQDNTAKINTNKSEEIYKDFLRVVGNTENSINRETQFNEEPLFEPDNDAKIKKIAWHFEKIMDALGLDITDDSLQETPNRVAKMYVNEIFSGLNPKNKPKATLFENKYNYNQMLVEKDIKVHSYCEHHFVPILGKAHVAYISNGYVIGLSKINRIVDYYSRRPQLQERLTEQIAEELKNALKTEDVAVIIEAEHMCVAMRGIKDHGSSTTSSSFHGKFKDKEYRNEFFSYLNKTK
ncbi:MAG: GTP cyclohydrolase I FolE [Bacteroidales bacterium]|nr:GTP cyclohydrolase I FolE [Bacteroidales bacterium]